MKYQELVVNGCSYMDAYAQGQGHQDLAERLGIPTASSLAISGSANGRILRTTLKHSYLSQTPNFYMLGMTFLSRDELPILISDNEFEGAWTNPQNQMFNTQWMSTWTERESQKYVDLKLRWEMCSILDRMEDLQYRMLAIIGDLQKRGHGILMFNQADNLFLPFADNSRLKFLGDCANIIDGYRWRSICWQHDQGVPSMDYSSNIVPKPPDEIKHRKPGHHVTLNQYLADYINQNHLLQ
jgi:hypothetical protein